KDNEFQKSLSNYASFIHYNIPDKNSGNAVYDEVLRKLKGHEIVVVGIHNTTAWNSRTYGITENTKSFVEKLQQQNKNVIVSVFASPYSLKFFKNSNELICGYEDNDFTRKLVPQLIFGGFGA